MWTYASKVIGVQDLQKYLRPSFNFFSRKKHENVLEVLQSLHEIVFNQECPRHWWDRNTNGEGNTVMAMLTRRHPPKEDGRREANKNRNSKYECFFSNGRPPSFLKSFARN